MLSELTRVIRITDEILPMIMLDASPSKYLVSICDFTSEFQKHVLDLSIIFIGG